MSFKRSGSPYYWVDFTWRGARVRKSTGQTKKSLGDAVEQEWRRQARERGAKVLMHEPPVLKDFAVQFLNWVEASPKDGDTKKYYQHGWRLISATKLAGMRMNAITNHDLEMTSFPGSNYNANCAIATLRRMYGKAIEMGEVFETPKLKNRRVVGRQRLISADEETRLLEHLTGDSRDVYLVMRYTSARNTEVYSMRWENFHWDDGSAWYRIPDGKYGGGDVPLLPMALGVLKERFEKAGKPSEGWVFPSPKSVTGHIVGIAKAFRIARDAAGLPSDIVPYLARHAFGTEMAEILGNPAVLMKIMRHKNIATSAKYLHPPMEQIHRAVQAHSNKLLK